MLLVVGAVDRRQGRVLVMEADHARRGRRNPVQRRARPAQSRILLPHPIT